MDRYELRPVVSPSLEKTLAGYPALTRELLVARNIETPEAAEAFLHPVYEALHDPFAMKGMEKAVERILRVIKDGEKIIIYSDYDADGIPGAVVLAHFFKKIGVTNFENYIPHRHDEGFGLNVEAIKSFAEKGAKLLITIDCGIADVAEVEYANKLGLNVIITDHHEPGEKLPEAFAILDAKQKDCSYPFRQLCGSGVAFKLVQALLARLPSDKRNGFKDGHEKWLLDMVGLATLSDMVPLRDENRILSYYGLAVLRKSPRVGLGKLLAKLGINQKHLTEDDIAFMVTPRINAASRMGIPLEAFRLLSTEDEVLAGELAEYLDSINEERKVVVAGMVKDMKQHVEKRELREVIVLGNPEWKPALLGLAANTLMEAHNRPVFLWGREDETTLKGSCRGTEAVSTLALMQATAGSFIQFGGHQMAGGFSVSHEKIHLLDDALNAAYSKIMTEAVPIEKTMIDRELSLDEVSWRTWGELEKFAPFGAGNPKPLFLLKNVPLAGVKQFGKQHNHLELSFVNSAGRPIKAISFFSSPEAFSATLAPGNQVNLVATMEKSMFRSTPELRLRIVDIF